MRNLAFVVAGLLTVSIAPAAPLTHDKASKAPAVEQKLHGAWKGAGPCTGSLQIGPDGKFERRNYGPDGITITGTWKIRWDALPPTLVMTGNESDDPDDISRNWEVKVIELDDTTFACRRPDSTNVIWFTRVK